MEVRRAFALISLALGLACPVSAGAQTARRSAKPPATPAATIPDLFAASRDTAFERRSRVGDLRELDAVDPTGQRVLRSLSVADNAEFGLGILSVSGETEKRLVRQRTDPRIEIAPGRTRMAGAGFAIRF